MLPFWTGFLPRLGAWIGLLRDGGWVNGVLMGLGLVEAPLPLLYTDGALLLGMVHAYLPFAVLPLVAALTRLDPSLEEAAADLGASPATAFRTVVLPLTLPGAAAGFLLVFIPAMGEVVIPELLGPPEARLVGRVLWDEFFRNRDWPLAAAVAVLLLARADPADPPVPAVGGAAVSAALLRRALGTRASASSSCGRRSCCSCSTPSAPTASRSNGAASPCAGSRRWPRTRGCWKRPGSRSASPPARRRSRCCSAAWPAGRWPASGRSADARCSGRLAGAPLVLPEVVTGLSLLLLFVAAQAGLEASFGWRAERGAFTVLLAHATLGLAYAAVLVQARLATLDRSLEDAAADLGAGPFTVFRTVTLPLIAPALAAGWLLAFTLSLDDVVLASFVSGPAGTTMPMLVFSALRVGVTPEVNALGTAVLAVVALATGLGWWAVRGRRGAAPGL